MMLRVKTVMCVALLLPLANAAADQPATKADEATAVDLQWGLKIPLRDGVKLNATLYRPQGQKEPLPCIFTLTPYVSQRYHDLGMYFGAHGYVFATVDVRGRGNSGGEFTPLLQEANDGPQIVEWLAAQTYCNGKITMSGGSYAGYDQWATAKERPPHLATIVPVASPKPGVDFPPRQGNINFSFDMAWITLTSGHTAQDAIYGDGAFWTAKTREWYESGRSFKELDVIAGVPSPTFQTWLAHPAADAYWDSYVPTAAQYAAIDLPILTITGQYDGDQPGAISFYRQHMALATEHARQQHYLIMGPWDHSGTRKPQAEYSGLRFGQASVLDMNKL
ncbi:MAG: CocE/NonD family hydrolase, partial [Dokdonella sp.]